MICVYLRDTSGFMQKYVQLLSNLHERHLQQAATSLHRQNSTPHSDIDHWK